jgi:hypothetical protein
LDAGLAFSGEFWSDCEKASADTNSIATATPAVFFDQDFEAVMRNSTPLENKQPALGLPWSSVRPYPQRQSIRPTVQAWEMIPESGSPCQ